MHERQQLENGSSLPLGCTTGMKVDSYWDRRQATNSPDEKDLPLQPLSVENARRRRIQKLGMTRRNRRICRHIGPASAPLAAPRWHETCTPSYPETSLRCHFLFARPPPIARTYRPARKAPGILF